MADESSVVAPQEYKTRGLAPRGLVIGILVVFLSVAVGAYVVSMPADTEPMLPEDVAKKNNTDPASVATQRPGNPALIDEMISDAEKEAKYPKAASAPGRAGQAPVPRQPLPTLNEVVKAENDALNRRTGGDEEVRALREASEKAAKYGTPAMIFDESGETKEGPERTATGKSELEPGGLDQLAELERKALAAQDPSGLAEVLRSAAGGKSSAPSSAEESQRWAEQQRQGQPVLPPLRAVPKQGRFVISEGTTIPAVTTRTIDSDLPGVVTAMVTQDVYDSTTSRVPLIPMGSYFRGSYNNQVSFGQERLQFGFTRLRFPDGRTIALPGSPGSDAAGRSGVTGDVNRHYARTLGGSILLGLLADRVVKPATIPQGSVTGGSLSATGQILAETARTELERLRGTPTTITIPEGVRINVEVLRDIAFDAPYQGRRF